MHVARRSNRSMSIQSTKYFVQPSLLFYEIKLKSFECRLSGVCALCAVTFSFGINDVLYENFHLNDVMSCEIIKVFQLQNRKVSRRNCRQISRCKLFASHFSVSWVTASRIQISQTRRFYFHKSTATTNFIYACVSPQALGQIQKSIEKQTKNSRIISTVFVRSSSEWNGNYPNCKRERKKKNNFITKWHSSIPSNLLSDGFSVS